MRYILIFILILITSSVFSQGPTRVGSLWAKDSVYAAVKMQSPLYKQGTDTLATKDFVRDNIVDTTNIYVELNKKIEYQDTTILVPGIKQFKDSIYSHLQRIYSKEDSLPSTPLTPENKYLNGNRQWSEISIGSGGYSANLYLTRIKSTIYNQYFQTSYDPESTDTTFTGTANSGTGDVLFYTALYESPVSETLYPAGLWTIDFYGYVSSNSGITRLKFEYFKRSASGLETTLFSSYSFDIDNITADYIKWETTQPVFDLGSLDSSYRMGVKIYINSNSISNKTIYLTVGDGFASYFNTPNKIRHNQLRAFNQDTAYLHHAYYQAVKWNNSLSIADSIGNDGYVKGWKLGGYQTKLTDPITGTGASVVGQIPVFTTVNNQVAGNANVTYNGNTVRVGASLNSATPQIIIRNSSNGINAQTRLDLFNDLGETVGAAGNAALFFTSSTGTDVDKRNGLGFWNYSNGPIRFATNSIERVRITTSSVDVLSTYPLNFGGTGIGSNHVYSIYNNSGITIGFPRVDAAAAFKLSNAARTFDALIHNSSNGYLYRGSTTSNDSIFSNTRKWIRNEIFDTAAVLRNYADSVSQASGGNYVFKNGFLKNADTIKWGGNLDTITTFYTNSFRTEFTSSENWESYFEMDLDTVYNSTTFNVYAENTSANNYWNVTANNNKIELRHANSSLLKNTLTVTDDFIELHHQDDSIQVVRLTGNGLVYQGTYTLTDNSLVPKSHVSASVAFLNYSSNYTPSITQDVYSKFAPGFTTVRAKNVTVAGDTITITKPGDYYGSLKMTIDPSTGNPGDSLSFQIRKNNVSIFQKNIAYQDAADMAMDFYLTGLVSNDDMSIYWTNKNTSNGPTFSNITVYFKREIE